MERYAAFLSEFISEHSTSDGPTRTGDDSWQSALKFLNNRRQTANKELQAAEEELQRIKDESAIVAANLEKIRSAGRRTSRAIEITVQSLSGKPATVSFSYVIRGASWNVSYEMYLEVDGQVTTNYYGNIYQETGEDWRNVRLSLSTATPSRGARRSEIAPVYVAAREIQTREGFILTERETMPADAENAPGGGAAGGETDTGGFAGVEASGESLVFEIPQTVDAPSSQRRQRVTIARFSETPAAGEQFYRIVPAIQETAHLVARVPNSRNYPLLAGPVDAFRNSGYTGRSDIEYTPAGGKFLVGFGGDQSMGVTRALKKSRESTGALSSGRFYHTEVTVEIRNRSDEARKATVYERVPVSDVDEVKVAIQNDTTGGYTETEPGILNWEFHLAPRASKQIKLHYRVRVPDNYPGDLYGN